MSDEKPLDLNDQFAIAALGVLLRGDPSNTDKFTICNQYIIGNASKIEDYQIEVMDRLARVAYQMARSMRKARLGVFE